MSVSSSSSSSGGVQCDVDGCVVPRHGVARCAHHECVASVCVEHARECRECGASFCPEHLPTPICRDCSDASPAYYDAIYRRMLVAAATSITPVSMPADEACIVPGCEIPFYGREQCAYRDCDAWVCAGHSRDCVSCDTTDFCPDHVHNRACLDCAGDFDTACQIDYLRAAAVIVRRIKDEKERNARRRLAAKRKAKKPPAGQPLAKVAK